MPFVITLVPPEPENVLELFLSYMVNLEINAVLDGKEVYISIQKLHCSCSCSCSMLDSVGLCHCSDQTVTFYDFLYTAHCTNGWSKMFLLNFSLRYFLNIFLSLSLFSASAQTLDVLIYEKIVYFILVEFIIKCEGGYCKVRQLVIMYRVRQLLYYKEVRRVL